jgi:hypothetical protein
MSPASFRFDHRDFPMSLQAILASLEEHFPQEISIIDWCEVTCHTKRTETILSALTEGAPQPVAVSQPTTAELYQAAKQLDSPAKEHPVHAAVLAVAQKHQPICAECSQPFTPKNKSSKYCSSRCAQRAYNRHCSVKKKSPNGNGGDPETKLGESRLLDIETGEISDHQDVLAAIREGKYPVGKRFRRSHDRIYEVVEQDRNGHPRLALKQVFDPLPIA